MRSTGGEKVHTFRRNHRNDVNIIYAIQARPGITAPELAQRCETDVRTIYRDLRALDTLAPITNDGYGKGYTFAGSFAMFPLNWTPQEALVFSMLPSVVDKTQLPAGFDSAYDKVMSAHFREKRQDQDVLQHVADIIQMGSPSYREDAPNMLLPIIQVIFAAHSLCHSQKFRHITERMVIIKSSYELLEVFPLNIQLGSFEVKSGQVVVSDPCYELDANTIIMGILEPALAGTWHAEVEKVELPDWGEANAKLTAYHQSVQSQAEVLEWIKCSFIVGVDSGQAGIFDREQYRIPDAAADDAPADDAPADTDSDWYLACCDITEDGEEAGVLEGGVVSRTGIGDGAYGVYQAVNAQGQVIGVKIVFIKS